MGYEHTANTLRLHSFLMFCARSKRLTGLIIGASLAFCALPAGPALACDGASHIRLAKPVDISEHQRAEFRAMAPLKVVAVNAPPMARYDDARKAYSGIATDIFCFISKELGISFEIRPDQVTTLSDKIHEVQQGLTDVFIPLSRTAERAKHGIFTLPYYESPYAVIARHDLKALISNLSDLARYRTGYVAGVSFEPLLQAAVPASQLHPYHLASSEDLFQAIQDGEIDVAVFNKNIFIEKRYREEWFDLEVIHTLTERARAYRYYFSPGPEHERLVEAFNQYLAAIDISASVLRHEIGERQFLERYMAQRHHRMLLQYISVTAAVLALVFCLAFIRYRRLSRELRKAYCKLEMLSRTDSLTKLSNRGHFDQRLVYEYARYRRTGSPLSLLLIDVDHFKKVNDHYGHAVGDEYLNAIARTLEDKAGRATDLVARYGGEEFICLLPDTPSEQACLVAERIRQGIASLGLPNALSDPAVLTVSVGVVTILAGAPGAETLVAQADAQLYTAKQSGRNRVCTTVLT